MNLKQSILAAGLFLGAASFGAEAALTSYNNNGVNLVYSSLGNITWTGDGNLLGSMIANQGYQTVVNAIIAASDTITDTPNTVDGFDGSYTISSSDFNRSAPGLTTWFGAMAFANYLNSINYAGTNQWRLPGGPFGLGLDQKGSEFGKLYYSELNRVSSLEPDYGIFGTGITQNVVGTVDAFSNVHSAVYWTGAERANIFSSAWVFHTYNGNQNWAVKNLLEYAWPVTPGQVQAASTVPVPGAAWLMATGLLGGFGVTRRRSAR